MKAHRRRNTLLYFYHLVFGLCLKKKRERKKTSALTAASGHTDNVALAW